MIPSDKLERYWDFVAPERSGQTFDPNYQYDPRKGLERLLACITPDPKALTVAAMGRGRYFTYTELNQGINDWLAAQKVSQPFPLERTSVWKYLRTRNRDSQQIDGSLIEIGAVVKETLLPTAEGYKTAYHRSQAGEELVIPLVQGAVDFVYEAKQFTPTDTTEKPKYTSMTRTLSHVASPNPSERRQLLVFDIVKLLVASNGKLRLADLESILQTHGRTPIQRTLTSLGVCGVINYKGIGQEKEGKRPIGWSNYEVVNPQSVKNADPAEIYQQIQTAIPYFHLHNPLDRALQYIGNHPAGIYNLQNLSTEINTSPKISSMVLNALKVIGILRTHEEFVGGEIQSAVEANDITHLFYQMVLKPAVDIAKSLEPLPLKAWDKRRLDFFSANYSKERAHTGDSEEGKKVRGVLLSILLSTNHEMKLSDVVKVYNDVSGRDLKNTSVQHHLDLLVSNGDLTKPKSGFYRMVQESET